jgi:hypothetical protein
VELGHHGEEGCERTSPSGGRPAGRVVRPRGQGIDPSDNRTDRDPGVVPSNPKAWGSTAQWRRVRRQVLERDGWLCRLRLPGCQSRATEVHHLYGHLRPGSPLGPSDYDVTPLAAACRNCNRRAGAYRGDPPGPDCLVRFRQGLPSEGEKRKEADVGR